MPLLSCSNTLSAPGEPPSTEVSLPDKYVQKVTKFVGTLPDNIPDTVITYQAWRLHGDALTKEKKYAEALYCYGEAFKVGPAFNGANDLVMHGGSQRSKGHLIAVSSPGLALRDKANVLVLMGNYEPALFYYEKWRENDYMAKSDAYQMGELCSHFELGQHQQVINKTGGRLSDAGKIVRGASRAEMGSADEGKKLMLKGWNDYVGEMADFGSSRSPAKRIKKLLTPGVVDKLKQAGGRGL